MSELCRVGATTNLKLMDATKSKALSKIFHPARLGFTTDHTLAWYKLKLVDETYWVCRYKRDGPVMWEVSVVGLMLFEFPAGTTMEKFFELASEMSCTERNLTDFETYLKIQFRKYKIENLL